MKILIIKTAALGDVLRTTVILEGLIEKYSNPKIYWLCAENAKPLIDNNPYIEKIYYREHLFPKKADKNSENEKEVSEISSHKYDMVISLEEDKELLQFLNTLSKKKVFGV